MRQFNRLLRVTVTALAAAMICPPSTLAKGPGGGGGKGGGGGGYTIVALMPPEGLALESRAADLNEAGAVVGYYRDADNAARAFRYDSATDDFQPLSGGTIAQGINNLGGMVGEDEAAGVGLYWNSADVAPVFVLPLTDHVESRALGINQAGIICGVSTAPDGTSHAAAWISAASGDVSNGVDLGPLSGDTDAEAYRINESVGAPGIAQVVGVSSLREKRVDGDGNTYLATVSENAVAWTIQLAEDGTLTLEGGPTDLGSLGGGLSLALSVNNGGAICGESDTWPFLALPGSGMLPLEGLRGADFGSAGDVNDSGRVVGYLYY